MCTESRPSTPPPSAPEPDAGPEDTLPQYFSLILRCRTTATGLVHVHLSDIHSGLTCSVSDLDKLPDLVRRWIANRTEE